MKNKKLAFFVFLLIGFLFGVICSALFYAGIIEHFFKGVNSVPFYVHIIYVIFSFFLVILIHELGHLVSFVHHGIKIKAIYVLGFALIKLDRGWRLKFVPKFFLMLGGIVIPDHVEIKSIEEEEKYVDTLQKVLIAGPNTSIYYAVIVTIIWFIFMFFNIYLLNGFLFTVILTTVLMTLVVVKTSKLSQNGLYGDYIAHKKIKDDKVFRLSYLIQATTMFKEDLESNKYLWPKIVEQLSSIGRLYSNNQSAIFLQYLHEVTFNKQIGCTKVEDKMKNMEHGLPLNEEGLLIYHQLVYFYKVREDNDMVNKLLEDIKVKSFKVDPKVRLYHDKLTSHLLKLSDETEFLSNKKNIYPNATYFVFEPLELNSDIKDMQL